MFLRTMVLTSGLCGALAAAQFPAYSQQYLQRLGGAVDALQQVVADFDASASALGMSSLASEAPGSSTSVSSSSYTGGVGGTNPSGISIDSPFGSGLTGPSPRGTATLKLA